MIFPYPEVHEMERDGDIYRCPYCEQAYIFKDGKLRTQQSGTGNAQHTYNSPDMRIGVEVKGIE